MSWFPDLVAPGSIKICIIMTMVLKSSSMKAEFHDAADLFAGLIQAIAAHARQHPDSPVRDVTTALENLNAVFVTAGADRRSVVGVSCGDGRETFYIEGPMSDIKAVKIARHLCGFNNDMRVLLERRGLPLIAVQPERIVSITSADSALVLGLRDTDHSCQIAYADAHSADIDSILLENKLVQARFGGITLKRLEPLSAVDGFAVALPYCDTRLQALRPF